MPPPERAPLRRGILLLHRLEDWLLALMLGSLILIAAAQILLRNFLGWNLPWGDPLARMLVLWVALLGALAASRTNRHISVDVLSQLLHGRARAALEAFTALFTAAISLLVSWHATRFVISEAGSPMSGLWGWPSWVFQIVIPLGFGLIGLRYLLLCLSRALSAMKPPP